MGSRMDITTADMLQALLEKMDKLATPAIPVQVDLWDTKNIAAYLKRSVNTVRDSIVTLPTFPRPVRLPVEGRAQALWKAREVIAWAEKHQS